MAKEKQADYKEKTKEMFGNKLRSRPTASKQQDDTESNRIKSGTPRQKEERSNALIGENEIYTLIMRTIVPLIALLLIKYLYDKGGSTNAS